MAVQNRAKYFQGGSSGSGFRLAYKITSLRGQVKGGGVSAMIMNDEVSSNAILKRATKHYTVMIKPKVVG